jgi:hypothetical protein
MIGARGLLESIEKALDHLLPLSSSSDEKHSKESSSIILSHKTKQMGNLLLVDLKEIDRRFAKLFPKHHGVSQFCPSIL